MWVSIKFVFVSEKVVIIYCFIFSSNILFVMPWLHSEVGIMMVLEYESDSFLSPCEDKRSIIRSS